ncbi:Surface antigen [Microbulbifer donghaiensis]|uniref:Surface antigen n=1 Tax=Microbulbifer donghaiensis TaxID=494016 RepID=A0A1M4X6W0_9GAMM|nr:glycine zipper 2TM domain-containing protein [Microbulbifer donghaiensis]SHE89264.1 Surface antigen [Microbulbifer donghaiensis]
MNKLKIFAAFAIASSLATATYADPPEGRGWKKHRKHDRYVAKEEYWDGNCKVERKWEADGDYKEERKCKAVHHHHQPVAQVVVLPPWFERREQEPVYQPEWRPAPQPTASRCNSDKVGAVLGGIVGGVLGNQIGGGNGKKLATLGGAIAGVLVGGKIGERMDSRNQACVGQALEFAPDGQRIAWQDGGQNYAVTPGPVERRGDRYCRSFTAEVQSGEYPQSTQGAACRQPDGTWVQL